MLLDDPLSAVDAHVANALFRQCLAPGTGLLARHGVACVLVTNHVWVARLAGQVLLLSDGTVSFNGTAAEFAASELPEAAAAMAAWKTVQEEVSSAISNNSAGGDVGTKNSTPEIPSKCNDGSGGASVEEQALQLGAQAGQTLMTVEDRSVGQIDLAVLKRYVTIALLGWVLQLVFFVLERLTYSATDWWLSRWAQNAGADAGETEHSVVSFGSHRDSGWYLRWYGVLAMINAAVVFVRTRIAAKNFVVSAKVLFTDMLRAVLRAPLEFFETTPHGRITNRFSFDTDICDIGLYLKMSNALSSIFWGLNAIGVLVVVSPLCAIGLAVILGMFVRVWNWYRCSSRELQRLDAAARSPIQALFSEAIDGALYIRAFGQAETFASQQARHLDVSLRAIWSFQSANRWLTVRTELMGGLVMVAVGGTIWLTRSNLDGGYAGLALVWALNLTVTFGFMIRDGTEAESRMTSVERVLSFSDLVPEAPLQLGGLPIGSAQAGAGATGRWITEGKLEFRAVEMRYRAGLPLALAGLSFSLEGGERCAVVGRTGAGKSSIAVALFRLVEPCGGSVLIDGIDCATLGLHALRRDGGLASIPQDPLIFEGSLRRNLDPFDEFRGREDKLVDVLERCCLGVVLQALGGLDTPLAELSMGQRQLLCLGRALLRAPRILVMDEATASVDLATDKLIQTTVRTCFAEATVLCVAHRIATVMDYDTILCLRGGVAVEQGPPQELLRRPHSLFRALAESHNGQADATPELAHVRGNGGVVHNDSVRGNASKANP